MKKNWILLLTLFVLFPFFSGAQSAGGVFEVAGKVLDSSSRQPVVYATIHLLDENGTPCVSGYTRENGTFRLQYDAGKDGPEAVTLQLSGAEYEDRKMILQLKVKNLGVPELLLLMPASKSMDAVVVTATKKIIEVQPGKIIYNAENDVTNKGGSAADILRKAPVLNVDGQGNVSMRGNTNLKILVDGKYSGQIARSPADALNMMPADIVKAVEVITTPSAKYDAEGAAGIINIITKKNSLRFSGALEMAAGNLEQVFNPRIAVAANKWSFSLHGHLHQLRTRETAVTEREQITGERLYQSQHKDNRAPHGSGDIAVIYTPDERSEWSLGINYWFGKWPDNSTVTTRLYAPDDRVSEAYIQAISRSEHYLGADMNLGYNRRFRKYNRELTLLAQFTPARSRSPYDSRVLFEGPDSSYREQNTNGVRNKEWTLQADYNHPFNSTGDYILETGIKAILRNVINRYEVFTETNGAPPVADPERSDIFSYKQNIWAGYTMLKAKWEQGWYAEAGLRYERTDISGQFRDQATDIRNQFDNLIPSFNFSRKLNERHLFGLSYTQRLTRPYIWDLNPNANASDPKNIETGNPALQPEIMHQAELTYGFQAASGYFFNTALFWKRTNNAIIDFTEITGQGVFVTRKENMASNIMYGINLSGSVRPNNKWSVNGNINLNYLDYAHEAWQVFNRGWAADMNMNTTFKLPTNYSLQLFGEYSTRKVTLQGYETPSYYYVFAVKKEFPRPKISVTGSAFNPFTSYIPRKKYIAAPGFTTLVSNRNYLQGFRVAVNWEFGRNASEKSIRKVSNDDIINPTKK
ncbi:outer membrane beta-barrel family protein [Niabella beijingensis]|uniref:outer membrane beta-barrel family protein n=1 Tax=Niabella beijingensis TaxID=2872700 RepID=UPI001CBCCB7F|nr:outer membrane beta-barrel family protein [Niabella beijingensis]MBZ4191883.1 TonB-dependent receptor [Niabella beijingensis]